MTRRTVLVLGLALAFIVAGAVVGILMQSGSRAAAVRPTAQEGFPTALSAHLEQLSRALPGTEGMAGEGPASGAEQEFMERAYPSDTIAVQQMDAARAAFAGMKNNDFPSGWGKPGTWVSVGPSQALYPSSQFLNSFLYVPNAYIAGGRTTAVAISDSCKPGNCRMYITPAGGGVWRTKNALADDIKWEYLGGPLGINAAGAVTIDANDPTGNTVYVGTGEANICGSGCVAGTGLYKSTNGGDTWTGPIGKPEFAGKGIGADRDQARGTRTTLYVGSTTALRGMTSVCCSGVTRPVPGAAKWGLYKSTDGGANWSFIHNGSVNVASCTGDLTEFNNGGDLLAARRSRSRARPVESRHRLRVFVCPRHLAVERSGRDVGADQALAEPGDHPDAGLVRRYDAAERQDPDVRLRGSHERGRPVLPAVPQRRRGHGRSGVHRPDQQQHRQPGLGLVQPVRRPSAGTTSSSTRRRDIPTSSTSAGRTPTARRWRTSAGSCSRPTRASTGTDMTFDGTDMIHPNGLHPDQHSLVTVPGKPFQFFETNDGGVMRSSGEFVDRSSWCDDPNRNLGPTSKARCKQMLSRIPSMLQGVNKGLSTLQFQSLSVSPFDSKELQGGTQDNGTWENFGSPVEWHNTMIGDGGQSGFDVAKPGVPLPQLHGRVDRT